MRFCILGSGSSGNSALLQTAQASVLIDAGFSARRLNQLLAAHGLSLEQIDAIFLTHEHGDHCAAIGGLKKHPHIRLYANEPTARAIQSKLKHRPRWMHFETGARFRYRDMEVTSFSVPHDAQEPVGFRIDVDGANTSTGASEGAAQRAHTLLFLTDLGYAPAHIQQHLAAADIVVIEANHCPALLQADTKRPWSLKQRIGGRHGHLSNEATATLLAAVPAPRWRQLYLVHLSRDCNSPQAVAAALAPLRERLPRCAVTIVEAGGGSAALELDAAQHVALAAPCMAAAARTDNAADPAPRSAVAKAAEAAPLPLFPALI